MTAGPVAAIDIGTNSTRLLILDRDGQAVVRRSVITRLGAGVDTTRRLAADAIERTLAVLASYRLDLEAHHVQRGRVIATSAARDADNREELFDRAAAVVGHRPELLTGAEEGRLAFAGATAGLAPARAPFLVIDIGGGSTELIVGDDEPIGVRSLDVGCVRLTETELQHDPPRAEELSNAIGLVSDRVDDVVRELPELGAARTVIGVAGTITTVAAIELGLRGYDREATHHFVLTRAAVEDVFRTLATEPLADRRHNPGLAPERADVIVGGCCILVALVRRLHLDEIVVSESDLLDATATILRGE